MDNIKYLKELRKQNKLPELLRKLGLPHEEVKTENHECNAHFLPNSLTIVEWEKFPAYGAERTDFYELNDYMFLAGVKDPGQKRLQKLFDFMKENFYEFEGRENAYQEDCINYLADQQRQRQEALQAECDKKKLDVEYEIGEKMMLVIDGKQ